MLFPHRIPPNDTSKRRQQSSNRGHDVQRLQMTSKDLKTSQMTSNDLTQPETNTESTVKRTSNKRNKNDLKTGSVHENIEIDNKYVVEFRHNNNV